MGYSSSLKAATRFSYASLSGSLLLSSSSVTVRALLGAVTVASMSIASGSETLAQGKATYETVLDCLRNGSNT